MLKCSIRNFTRLARRTFGALALTAALAAPAASAEQAMIILDASGSMWGQIGGKSKIAIAREVLETVIGSGTLTDPWLGLMAYGHREKGSCSDIEVLYAPAPGAGPEIVGTVKDINPKGKTPLSAAVRMAAEQLKYTEQKATVILVTDGLETCSADPCALAAELEKSGVDFTTHVVGFGLSPEEGKQVACLADLTGGTYFQASDSDGLADALATSVAEAAEAPAPAEPPPPPAELPKASLGAPDSVPMGTAFAVAWDGPGEQYDHVWIFDPNDGPEGNLVRGRRLSTSPDYAERSVTLVAPTTPGTYELQYHYGRSRDVIATRAIEVVATAVSLDAPATVDIGTTFEVSWVGPGGKRDDVQLFDEADGPDGKVIGAQRLANADFKNRKAKMTAPVEPGFYTLRYYNGDDRTVLATRQIEVLPAEVSLDGPDTVDMGSTFEVAWVGPGDNRDQIEVFDPKDGPKGKVVAVMRVTSGDYAKRTVALTAPVEPGEYVLRYYNTDHSAVLATRSVTVIEADVSLDGPEQVDMGTIFSVSWVGPGDNRDQVEIFDPKDGPKGKVVFSKRLNSGDTKNRTVELIAPIAPGDYILRYYNSDHSAVLFEQPLTVVAMEVGVEGPASVGAGETFTVTWKGPGAYRDSVEILDANGKAAGGQRVINGDYKKRMVTLKAPKAPGSYTIRYWNGEGGVQLADQAIEVR